MISMTGKYYLINNSEVLEYLSDSNAGLILRFHRNMKDVGDAFVTGEEVSILKKDIKSMSPFWLQEHTTFEFRQDRYKVICIYYVKDKSGKLTLQASCEIEDSSRQVYHMKVKLLAATATLIT